VFYIGFTSGARVDNEGWQHARGELTLGSAVEGFESDLGTWSMGAYEAQWREAIARLLSGASSAVLLTSYRGPGAGYHFMWPMWREGSVVHFQERILFVEEIPDGFDPAQVYDYVGERITVDDEGRRVSEWSLPLGQLATFLVDR
jgi:hypothetical protein